MSVPVGVKKAAVLCVLRSDAGFLLVHRTKDPHEGKYIPLGGHIEPFETPRAAAIREVREEAGIQLDDVRLRGIMTETSPTKFNWINYIYTGDTQAFEPPQCPEGILEWVDEARLTHIPTPTTDAFIYEHVSRSEFFVFDAVYDENTELLSLVDELSGSVLFESPLGT